MKLVPRCVLHLRRCLVYRFNTGAVSFFLRFEVLFHRFADIVFETLGFFRVFWGHVALVSIANFGEMRLHDPFAEPPGRGWRGAKKFPRIGFATSLSWNGTEEYRVRVVIPY